MLLVTSQSPAPRVNANMLKDIGLFGGLDDESLSILARDVPTRQVAVGEVVVREGDVSREMFVVIVGELEVAKTGRSGDVRVAVFGPGDWFGEMALLEVQPRSATVRALAPTILLAIGTEHLDRLLYRRDIKAYSLFIMNIARELSRRLRVADGLLAQIYASVADGYATRPPRT